MANIRSIRSLANDSRHGIKHLTTCAEAASYVIPKPVHAYAGLSNDVASWHDLFASEVEASSPEVSIFEINEVFSTPNSALLTLSGAIIEESLFPYVRPSDVTAAFSPHLRADPETGAMEATSVDFLWSIAGLTRLRSTTVYGRDHGEAGYFHWLNSVIPRLSLFNLMSGGLSAINNAGAFMAPRGKYQYESLAACLWPNAVLKESDGNTTFFDKLIYCTPLLHPDLSKSGGFFERSLLGAKLLRDLRPAATQPGTLRRLFISREDAMIRRLNDEPEIVRRLESLEVEAVTLSGMSFFDQVRIFSEAELVIGVHGAGLANVAFMNPGTKVVEVLSPERLWPTYRGVAARSDLRYFPYVASSEDAGVKNDSDISLQATHFFKFVCDVLDI